MKKPLLLLKDVDGVGRKGDVVSTKPGYARNFLLPKKIAILAEKHTIKLQEKLREERAKQSIEDKKESEKMASVFAGQTIETEVKVDASGHMYGSVSATDIAKLCSEQLQLTIEKRNVLLPKPIKKLGTHEIELKLKEGIQAKVSLVVTTHKPKEEEKTEEAVKAE